MKDYFFLSVILCLTLAVCSTAKVKPSISNCLSSSPGVSAKCVPDFHEFNWKLCKALHEVEKNNAVISSLSVKLVLMMLYEGALGNTATQIESTVGFVDKKQIIRERYLQKLQSLQTHSVTDDFELNIGSKLLMHKTITPNQDFLDNISSWYDTSYEAVDFTKPEIAIDSINQWVKNVTHGRIQQIINEDDTKDNIVLLLLNAIYFKGSWKVPFLKELTADGPFYLNSMNSVNVPLMTNYNNFGTSTLASLNARIISLPFLGDKFVMYIILPDSKSGLDNLINKIDLSVLSESIKNMKSNFTKVVMPKFNFEYTSILGPILQKLGISDMFGMKANLSNIGKISNGKLVVSNVIQKAGIEVNEEGSSAHAVTEVVIDHRVGFGQPEVVFEINRPFLFMIQDLTMNTIVFVGQVKNPFSPDMPVASVPVAHTQSPMKQEQEIVHSKINLDDPSINFKRFTYFDFELFQALSYKNLDSNFAASPSSIKHILSLLSEGAQGDTLSQLNTVLRLPNSKSTLNNLIHRNQLSMESSLIDIAVMNNLFVKNRHGLSKKFVDEANDLYSANITEIDFQNLEESIKMINKRVSSDTNGHINSIITKDDIDRSTELLLANVLYFKANWLYEFNESNTKDQCFFSKSDVCNTVKMMHAQQKIKFAYVSDINAKVIELPYSDTNFSMVVLLPDKGIEFSHFLNDLKHNYLTSILNLLRQRTVDVALPRFTINYSTKLMDILKKMGLTSIFEWNNNLATIFDPPKNVAVKDFTHKVAVEVNEKGSRASAITVANVMTLSNTPEMSVENVVVDRPFAFFIIHRSTKNTLFSGHIQNINPIIPVTRISDMMDQEIPNQQYVPTSPVYINNNYQQPQPVDKSGVSYKIN